MAQKWLYYEFMVGRPPKNEATAHGKRLSEFRKGAGLSQTEVANALGIPQRTYSFYERDAKYLPSNLVEPLGEVLGVSFAEILGIKDGKNQKRGPKSKLERQFEAIQKLPRTKQEFVSKLLGQILAAESA